MKRLEELDVEVTDDEVLLAVTRTAREILTEAAVSLAFLAEDLQARLATMPAAAGAARGLAGAGNSRARARLVSMHLRAASKACQVASVSATKCWRSFVKHFAPELDAARRGRPQKAFEIKGATR